MKNTDDLRAAACAVMLATAFVTASCGKAPETDTAIGSAEDRKALFEELVEKTMRREAFSPEKNRRLDLDVENAMRALEDDVVGARSQEELFYALARLSNARKDRHLSVRAVPGGLASPRYYPGSGDAVPVSGVRVDVDYSVADDIVLFVSDVAADAALAPGVAIGDRVLSVNGVTPAERFEQARPYIRYSTEHGFRKKFSQRFATRTGLLPPALYNDTLDLTLENRDGETYDVSLPYVDAAAIEWQSESQRRFPGFELVAERPTFDLYRSSGDAGVIVLDWHRFHARLIEDMDWLMEYAAAEDILDHDIVFNATRSGGGSLGAYAIQRLSPKAFKTTFGNLRISDVIPAFIKERVEAFEQREAPTDHGGKETIDDGTWLIEWLTEDVQQAYDAGREYSNNVPFKLAHAPKDSDGMIQPADVHFTGNMVCIMGPNGGSHLDQFYAIVTDNGLCDTIGMDTGGYSNTWEWTETVEFPGSGRPVISFMWNIGHTISPGGRIVEGDPSEIGEFIPLTRDNVASYDDILLRRALEILATK